LYRILDSMPSSFAQTFEACREKSESATSDNSAIRGIPAEHLQHARTNV
jgi:hypothetical protein